MKTFTCASAALLALFLPIALKAQSDQELETMIQCNATAHVISSFTTDQILPGDPWASRTERLFLLHSYAAVFFENDSRTDITANPDVVLPVAMELARSYFDQQSEDWRDTNEISDDLNTRYQRCEASLVEIVEGLKPGFDP